jgi:hypothetical protein
VPSEARGSFDQNPRLPPSASMLPSSCDADPPHRCASHWPSYELSSVQTLLQSASSSHHHHPSLQPAPETERPCTRPALVAARWPVAEMPHGDAA